jgi:hypothetical protein
MAFKTGTIESVAKTGKSVKIEGQWYGAFAKSQLGSAGVGDTIAFTYVSVEKEGTTFHNIKGNVTLKEGGGGGAATPAPDVPSAPRTTAPAASYGRASISFPLAPLDGQRVIVRQNALAHATKLVVEASEWSDPSDSDLAQNADFIIEIARKFESYVAGDLDMEEAKKGLE